MIEAVIVALIYLLLLALVVYLVIWVLGVLGISLPQQVIQIIWVIVALVGVLIIVRTVLPRLGVKLGAIPQAVAAVQPGMTFPVQKFTDLGAFRSLLPGVPICRICVLRSRPRTRGGRCMQWEAVDVESGLCTSIRINSHE